MTYLHVFTDYFSLWVNLYQADQIHHLIPKTDLFLWNKFVIINKYVCFNLVENR